jgi:hypothetical protein
MYRPQVGAFFEILEKNVIELVLLNERDRILTQKNGAYRRKLEVGMLFTRKERTICTQSVQKRKGKQSYFLPVSVLMEITCHPHCL